MNCKEFTDFLADYLDGELPSRKKLVFEQHLAVCPDCVTYMESYNQMIGLLKERGLQDDSDLPEDVPQSLIDAILSAKPK